MPDKPKSTFDFPPESWIREFYQSPAWQRLSYATKVEHGSRCQCCGHGADDGVKIVADHIKPIRYNWALRLDPSNIQVLCEGCNLGKGSWGETDHRQAAAAVIVKSISEALRTGGDAPAVLKNSITTSYSAGEMSQEDAITLIRKCGLKHT